MAFGKSFLLATLAITTLLASAVPGASAKRDSKDGDEFFKTMEEQVRKVVKGGVPETPDFISFTNLFPKNPFQIISVGEETELLVGMSNKGSIKQTVFQVSGALVHPQNFSITLRNLTRYRYDVTIGPNEEATIPYLFVAETEPSEYGLVVNIDYYDGEEVATRSVGYSGKVTLVGTDSAFDFQSLSVYAIIIGFFSSIGYFAYTSLVAPKKTKTRTPRPAPVVQEEEVKSDVPNMDWLPDHLKGQDAASKKVSPKIKKRTK
ncbi:translocon-associated protein [Blyttiomyces helicus]|uniref:Translocon-associated protein n=1 Tax=Blyttiomyces helicus TaxID=388810 RepID=A0A4P9WKK2_9FUNG|nr:translocon-associated protein [Blyttiomyces helicus]|eukprot:RKO92543.1 translocon-associated protein [Blyttiomyces helicus]